MPEISQKLGCPGYSLAAQTERLAVFPHSLSYLFAEETNGSKIAGFYSAFIIVPMC